MNNPTNKVLTIALVLLLLVNVAMLVFVVKDKKSPSRRSGKAPFERMVKELDMNEQQKKQYDSLRESHFSSIRPLFDSMRTTRQALFNLMKEETLNDSIISNYSAEIASKQGRADRLTLEHFRRVRSMFSGEQQKKFDDFVQKMMQGRGRKKDTSERKR